MATEPALITVDEAARILAVNRMTVYRRVTAGEIPVVNIGPKGGRPRLRIDLAALHQYVADHSLEIPKRGTRRGRAA